MKFCCGSMLSRVIMSSEFIKMRENIMELFENSFKSVYWCGGCQLPVYRPSDYDLYIPLEL